MKKRMFLLTAALLAALCTAAAALVPASLADDGEAEEQERRARVNGYLAAQFGEGWETAVAAYEDYGLGKTAEDGALFVIAREDGGNALYILDCADGKCVSATRCAGAVRPDETPEIAFELEDTIGLRYADGTLDLFALGADGCWRLRGYGRPDGDGLTVELDGAPRVRYAETDDGTLKEQGELAAWPAFETDIEAVDVAALPRDEASLLSALTDERDGVRALLAEGEAEFGRFTAVCAVSDARCALTVFADWSWEPRTPEETGICAYEVLAEGKHIARLDLPAYAGGIVDYEGESAARGEIAGWAQMPRPRTLTLVPVDGEGNVFSEAAMEFALSE